MPIPDFQTIMLPLLTFMSDNKDHSVRDAIEHLANHFELTPGERQELLSSGAQSVFDNRVGWAKTYLFKAGLLESPRRTIFKITPRGQQVLGQNHQRINISLLRQFPEFMEFIKPNSTQEGQGPATEPADTVQSTPEEILEDSYQNIRRTLAQDILAKIKACPPAFFERLVVELLVKMGYGGTIKDAGKATRLTNDGGIDGIIKEDRLGLDFIYIQAKRYDTQAIGRPDIQSFVGALDGQKATKGIFITTSRFAESAIEYVKTITKKVILMDGVQLANYMIDIGLGVSTFATYELKKIDNDYFEE